MVLHIIKNILIGLAVVLFVWFLYAQTQDVERVFLTVNVPLNTTNEELEPLLLMLEEHNYSATFFVSGLWVQSHENITRRLAQGNEIGCYSYSQKRLAPLTNEELRAEITQCANVFEERNISVKGFRAPNHDVGKKSYEIIKESFMYDASLYRRYEWFWENPQKQGLVEVPTTSMLLWPLDYRFGADTLGDVFFTLIRRVKQTDIVLTFDAKESSDVILDIEYLLLYYEKEGAMMHTISEGKWFLE